MPFKHRQQSFDDQHQQKRLFRSRLYFALGFVFILFLILLSRMAYLQWVNFQHYHAMAEGNRISIEAIPPVRGKIYDRNNIIIAENRPVFVLEFVRNNIKDMDSSLFHLKNTLPNISDKTLEEFFKRLKITNRYKLIHLPYFLSEEEAAIFSVNSHKFPGINLTAKLKRHYPFGKSAVHALGYVGKINQKELARIDTAKYRATNVIGKLGIEKQYEHLLHGTPGVQQIETNARGRIIRKLETQPAIAGKDIQLTLDMELQQYIEQYLTKHRAAVIVTEPSSGEILAFVSTPGYDPNLFVDGISHENYQALLNDPYLPLINRPLNGLYPPASTVKPFIGLAALEHNIISFEKTIFDPGYFEFKNHRYRNWKKDGHGIVDMSSSIVQSCDTYFYKLGLDMGVNLIHDYLKPFGFGQKTGIDLAGESKGILPSKKWKRETKGKPWFQGETIITSIGQGFFLSTPIQLAKATSILANRGKVITPHLLKNPVLAKNHGIEQNQIPIKDINNWNKIITSMEKVMVDKRGTARAAGKRLTTPMAGKTGTAQVFSIGQDEVYDEENVRKDLRNHSLFIGFSPIKNPKIAITIIIENATIRAAPVAVDISNFYFEKLEKTLK